MRNPLQRCPAHWLALNFSGESFTASSACSKSTVTPTRFRTTARAAQLPKGCGRAGEPLVNRKEDTGGSLAMAVPAELPRGSTAKPHGDEAAESPRNCVQFSTHPLTPKDIVSLPRWPTITSGQMGSEATAAQRRSQTWAGDRGPCALVVGPGREHKVLGPRKGGSWSLPSE